MFFSKYTIVPIRLFDRSESCQIRYVKNWQIFSLSDLPILGQTHFSDGMSKSYL